MKIAFYVVTQKKDEHSRLVFISELWTTRRVSKQDEISVEARHLLQQLSHVLLHQHMSEEMKHESWQLQRRGSAAGVDARQYLHKTHRGDSEHGGAGVIATLKLTHQTVCVCVCVCVCPQVKVVNCVCCNSQTSGLVVIVAWGETRWERLVESSLHVSADLHVINMSEVTRGGDQYCDLLNVRNLIK